MNPQILIIAGVGLIFLFAAVRAVRTRSIPQYGPVEVREKLSGPDGAILLDVRTKRERDDQHIKGSLHVPLHELRRRAGELARHKGREIICYCQSGNRSLSAALLLKRDGYRAASMRGGIVDWNFANRG